MMNSWSGIHQKRFWVLSAFLFLSTGILTSLYAEDAQVSLHPEKKTAVGNESFVLNVKIHHPNTSPDAEELQGPDEKKQTNNQESKDEKQNEKNQSNAKPRYLDVPLPKNFAKSLTLKTEERTIRTVAPDNKSQSIKQLTPGEFFGKTFSVTLKNPPEKPVKITAKWKLDNLESESTTLYYFPERIGKISLKNRGDVYFSLYYKDAPKNIHHISSLIRDGFYDGLTFHRLIKDFILQGGDPNGDGTGGRKPSVEPELNNRSFTTGTLGMAHGSKSKRSGTQFFITLSRQEFLDGQYTAIGKLKEQSLSVLEQLERNVKTDHHKGGRCGIDHTDKPNSKIVMEDVSLLSKEEFTEEQTSSKENSETNPGNTSDQNKTSQSN